MKHLSKILGVILITVILTLSIVTVVDAHVLDDCHKYCAKKYPNSFELYMACMDGCAHSD